ncbi:MAG: hypothetical protein JWM89_907, partial [Acidimicrobiales bacterium]|nr:hypothetical protein [Acidimicrobiales bacterium]
QRQDNTSSVTPRVRPDPDRGPNHSECHTPLISDEPRCLRSRRVLTVQDMKYVEQIAGVRNLAVHRHFDDLSPERAGLMEQQVSLFLGKLEDKVAEAPPGRPEG